MVFEGRVSLKSQTRSVRGDVRKSERKNKVSKALNLFPRRRTNSIRILSLSVILGR